MEKETQLSFYNAVSASEKAVIWLNHQLKHHRYDMLDYLTYLDDCDDLKLKFKSVDNDRIISEAREIAGSNNQLAELKSNLEEWCLYTFNDYDLSIIFSAMNILVASSSPVYVYLKLKKTYLIMIKSKKSVVYMNL